MESLGQQPRRPEPRDRQEAYAVTISSTTGSRVMQFRVPPCPGYGSTPEEWRGVRVLLGVALEAGPAELTMWCVDGLLNLDWLGLMRRE